MKRSTDRQLSVAHLCERYDVSRMCIFRWRKDREMNFPPPDTSLKGRDFWLEQTIIAWERERLANRVTKKVPKRRAVEKGAEA
jgi:predicted DNA-binding transcriptional regulator AlpA